MHDRQLLSLLYLASPTLPIGAFAYSQGLASAIELGWVADEAGLNRWMRGVLVHGLGGLDLPVLLRLHRAAEVGDDKNFAHWNDFLLASRETYELLQEELRLGETLRRLMDGHGLLGGVELPADAGYTALFAASAAALGVEARPAALGFAWTWAENQAAAACKAIPLGQTAAQRILMGLTGDMEPVLDRAESLDDHEIGATAPGLVLASSLHETQYSRLFRS
ncbi:MAG: urease accessory protein [Desulfovibrionales bacterium]|nr:urease accessory protein [Desulfovibrionales bacterium]